MDADRLDQELALLRSAYPNLEYRAVDGSHWVRIPGYPVPSGWVDQNGPIAQVEIAFQIPAQLGQAPYAFAVRPPLTLPDGVTPTNYTASATTPWGDGFALFSWSPNEPWVPKADVRAGANMLNFARSFADRLKEPA